MSDSDEDYAMDDSFDEDSIDERDSETDTDSDNDPETQNQDQSPGPSNR